MKFCLSFLFLLLYVATFSQNNSKTIKEMQAKIGAIAGEKNSVEGFSSVGDGAAGDFYWDANSTETPVQGLIVQVPGTEKGRWKRIYDNAINVKWFGAKGDSTTIDQDAIQAAINYALPKKLKLEFPSGTYSISSPIVIPDQASYWELSGQGEVVFNQITPNTPILYFQNEGSQQFTIDNFTFQWAKNPVSSDNKAIAILFDSKTNKGWGYYNFNISKLTFVNGSGIFLAYNNKRIPLWGGHFTDIRGRYQMIGSLLHIGNGINGGMPNNTFRNIYVMSPYVTNQPHIFLYNQVNCTLENIEFNLSAGQSPEILIESSSDVKINNMRTEGGYHKMPYQGLFVFSGVIHLQMDLPLFYNVTCSSQGDLYGIKCINKTNATITGGRAENITKKQLTGKNAMIYADSSSTVNILNCSNSSDGFSNIYPSTGPTLVNLNKGFTDDILTLKGTNAGRWNGNHYIAGPYHMWFDINNNIRIKTGIPTSDIDGIAFAKQTYVDSMLSAKPNGTALNSNYKNNRFKTGSVALNGDNITINFTVNHNTGYVPTNISLTPTSQAAAGNYYISNKSANSFTITFLTAPKAGIQNIKFDWMVN